MWCLHSHTCTPIHQSTLTSYLTDELFWHIYFTLVRKHLPDRAFTWGPDDVLPPMSSLDEHANAGFMLADLGKQFKQFGSRLRAPSGLPALELSTFGISRGGNSAAAVGGDAIGGGSTSAGTASGLEEAMASMLPCKPDGLLENDPDLEAYLQV